MTEKQPQPDQATRGHDERRLGRKLVYCLNCKDKRPPGGWQKACPGDKRVFMGGT